MSRSFGWLLIIFVTTSILIISILTKSFLQPAVTFIFLLICPGMALVLLLNINDFWAELSIALALSISLSAFVAEVMLLSGLWSPRGGLMLLIGLTILGGLSYVLDINGQRTGG